ncbi:MAG: Txe/YoeB family addiction module toxin [Reichenbachiella sp.]
MQIKFMTHGWEDYLYWQKIDNKVLKKVNSLIKECQRHPFEGTGKPEQLKENMSGWWSRRITGEHRLVYRVDDAVLVILQCRKHY